MSNIVGIDEVGRGCWAGPLLAAAVLLDTPIEGLRDSKKLRPIQREALSRKIVAQSAGYGIGWVSSQEVDILGLTAAVSLAMQRALDQLQSMTTDFDEIIIDGSYNFLPDNPLVTTLVRADDIVPAVSAASIIAKVARDSYMTEQADIYRAYGFERHVGYGTAYHRAQLAINGITPLHRTSYKPIQQLIHTKYKEANT